ncbi:hypothetical protein EW145_g4952 [Phellinidium pouzarii]|uniref:2,5-diamino-6-ribosylamino-4(3H)-pyrimidinone 5'-phosphate reductase n=1 Tax=Phellinidium pouzarii TaxID=167371 RepID=A0A4S4L6K2_9AGAM|nr:hypothetical protein EW145_g4952 [Phellinidium pouzarii]
MGERSVGLFLDQMLRLNQSDTHCGVHVTLTFAQSLDAKIAGRGGKQLILSCTESMIMAHRLRSMHDAILVGIGTALNDDPQLNTRLLPTEDERWETPLPVIMDADLRFRIDCKLFNNFKANKGRQPTLFTADKDPVENTEWNERRRYLEAEGIKVVPIPSKNGELDYSQSTPA